jgi:hypothetical protein
MNLKSTLLQLNERYKIIISTKKYSGLEPFLYAYILMTEKLIEENNKVKMLFKDPDKIVSLDATLANDYLEITDKVLNKESAQSPWSNYFNYCSNTDGSRILQLLLGVNTHINYSLVVENISQGKINHDDFFKMNDVLIAIIPQIHDYFLNTGNPGFLKLTKPFLWIIKPVIKQYILTFVKTAWKNIEYISRSSKKDTLLNKLKQKVEDNALKIIKLYNLINNPKALLSPWNIYKLFNLNSKLYLEKE